MPYPMNAGVSTLTDIQGRAFSGGGTMLAYIRNSGDKKLLVDNARFTPSLANGGSRINLDFASDSNLGYFKDGDVVGLNKTYSAQGASLLC